jgi:hypothetical protein
MFRIRGGGEGRCSEVQESFRAIPAEEVGSESWSNQRKVEFVEQNSVRLPVMSISDSNKLSCIKSCHMSTGKAVALTDDSIFDFTISNSLYLFSIHPALLQRQPACHSVSYPDLIAQKLTCIKHHSSPQVPLVVFYLIGCS